MKKTDRDGVEKYKKSLHRLESGPNGLVPGRVMDFLERYVTRHNISKQSAVYRSIRRHTNARAQTYAGGWFHGYTEEDFLPRESDSFWRATQGALALALDDAHV